MPSQWTPPEISYPCPFMSSCHFSLFQWVLIFVVCQRILSCYDKWRHPFIGKRWSRYILKWVTHWILYCNICQYGRLWYDISKSRILKRKKIQGLWVWRSITRWPTYTIIVQVKHYYLGKLTITIRINIKYSYNMQSIIFVFVTSTLVPTTYSFFIWYLALFWMQLYSLSLMYCVVGKGTSAAH